jgi:membrane protease subunit HflC
MSRLLTRSLIVLAVLGLAALFNALYVVDETQQALLVRFGRPIGVDVTPGLKVKLPFVDSVYFYDNRLLPLEPPVQQIILGDQKRLEVATYTRFRIADPLRFYQSVRTLEAARSQLTELVGSSLRRVLGQTRLTTLLTPERDALMEAIRSEVADKARGLGLDVVDVRIRSADLPPETSQAIYDRMKSERQREAKELRAQGFEWAQEIQARAERERTVLLAEAQRQAKTLRGEGDAAAAQLTADAFGEDPNFFAFYRSLLSYRGALSESAPTVVLTPDSGLLRYFGSGPVPSAK